jgi:hypothetical protein
MEHLEGRMKPNLEKVENLKKVERLTAFEEWRGIKSVGRQRSSNGSNGAHSVGKVLHLEKFWNLIQKEKEGEGVEKRIEQFWIHAGVPWEHASSLPNKRFKIHHAYDFFYCMSLFSVQ